MANVYYSKVMSFSAEKVWNLVRDFEALPVWFPFVQKTQLREGDSSGQVGAVRANTIVDGSVVEEKLLELSDCNRRIVYAVISGAVPTIDYSATLTVHEVSEESDQCFVEWTATFDVDGEVKPIAEWVRTEIFKTCLAELERVLRADIAD